MVQIAGSRGVLATVMDDGQELLLASAPSMSLRPWVQQGFPVMLMTGDRCPHLINPGGTPTDRRFDHPVRALDLLRIPA